MNNLQIFNNAQFGEIRTIDENGTVLFCGSDIAKALGYSNTKDALARHCKEDGVYLLLLKNGLIWCFSQTTRLFR